MANLSYKYRLYPNATQAERLDYLLWQGRKIYNGALAMRIEAWQERGEKISKYDLRDHWCAMRKEEPETFGLLPARTVDDLIGRLDKAYQAFFRRVKAGDAEPGFPRFKSRRTFNSLGYANGSGFKLWATSDGWAKLRLFEVGEIRVRLHRDIPDGWQIKYGLVKREKDGTWSVICQIERKDIEPPPLSELPAVGIDVGLHYLLALSDGTVFEHPRWYAEQQAQRRVLQRKIDRQRRANNPDNFNADGTAKPNAVIWRKSNRQRETEHQLAKLEAAITQKRWYFWHTTTDWLTRTYGIIAIEDLTLDFMIQNARLAQATHDAGLAQFWKMLEYKAAERGVQIIRVPPAYTSQTCSECGVVSADNRRSQASFVCVSCGHAENADVNAAKNILRLGLKRAVPARQGEIEAIGSEMLCEA